MLEINSPQGPSAPTTEGRPLDLRQDLPPDAAPANVPDLAPAPAQAPGSMAAAIRAMDWSQTPLGPRDGWPPNLRTALAMVLEARFAMAIAWGRELRMLFNDRYRPLLGAGRPRALGAPAAEVFAECWDVVGPVFAQVWRGESVALDDWYLPIERGGRLAHGWFTLSVSPIRGDAGEVAGVMIIVAETTGRIESERRLAAVTTARSREAERAAAANRELEIQRQALYDLFEQVPASIAVVRADDLVFEMANRHYRAAAGPRDLIGRRALDIFPQLRGRGFEQMIAVVRRTGEPCVVKEMAVDGRWWSFVLAPLKSERGAIDRVLSLSYEVSELVVARHHAEAATARLQDSLSLLDATLDGVPVGISVYDRELRVVQINDTLARWIGRDRERSIGRPVADVVPADLVERVALRIRRVFATGAASETVPVTARPIAGPSAPRDWLITYYPIHGETGEVAQVGVVVVDVTRDAAGGSPG
jgi:PAS domain S-box-containing protein